MKTKFEQLEEEFGHNNAVSINAILLDYTNFLCKWGYTDSDVYVEEPTAVDRYLNNK